MRGVLRAVRGNEDATTLFQEATAVLVDTSYPLDDPEFQYIAQFNLAFMARRTGQFETARRQFASLDMPLSMQESAEVTYWHGLLQQHLDQQDTDIALRATPPSGGEDVINGAFALRLVPISFYDFSIELLSEDELPNSPLAQSKT
jgi:hypothetical protein